MTTYKEITINGDQDEPIETIEITLDEAIPDGMPQEDTEEPLVKDVEPPKNDTKRAGRAQKRIKELVTEKRTAEEETARMRAENDALRQQLAKESKDSREVIKSTLVDQVESLKRELKSAIESGDSDGVVNLNVELSNALRMLAKTTDDIETYKEVEAPKKQVEQARQPQIADKAVEWIDEHPAFKTDPIFYQVALAVNNVLIQEGYSPHDDDFYDELNDRLSPRFPEVFGIQEKSPVEYSKPQGKTVELSSNEETENTSRKPKAEQTMSGSARAASPHNTVAKTKSNTVTLTAQDVAQAEKWGISLEQMAKRIKNLETNKDRNGYSPIFISDKR